MKYFLEGECGLEYKENERVNILQQKVLTYLHCKAHYKEIRVRGFQLYGDYMLPTIPVIFGINTLCGLLIYTLNYDFFFKFPYNFCGDFRLPVMLRGHVTRDLLYFL